METVEDTLQATLIGELECPVCFEYMQPPIVLCENGHNTCKNCRPELQHCPTCRGDISNIRCLTVEKMSEFILYPCINRRLGCKETYPVFLIAEHQAVCPCSPYSCPSIGCEWKGSVAELLTHVQGSHEDGLYMYGDGEEDMIMMRDFDENSSYNEITVAYNQVFVRNVAVKDNVWHFVLQYIGPKENASKFEYTITFDKKFDRGCIKVSQFSQSVKDDLDEIYKSCKCVKLPFDVVQGFLVEDDLLYSLFIKRST